MSKIGNLRSGSYGGGNLHTYDRNAKPQKTLADVRKARELAQKKVRKVTTSPKAAEAAASDFRQALNERITSKETRPYYGGKTIKSGGQFVSVSGEQIEARVQRRASQVRTLGKGNVTIFDASKGLYVPASPAEAKLIETSNKNLGSTADIVKQELTKTEKSLVETNKPKGLSASIKGLFGKAKNTLAGGWTKFKAFTKTPKGKWSLAIAAVVITGTALFGYVANRFSEKNRPTPTDGPDKINMPKWVEPTTGDDANEVNETEKADKSDKTDETKVPATESEKKEADKAAQANKDKREPDKVSGDEYEVVEGDCVWNIAKAHLKELNKDKADYTPSNVEILRHTNELLKINDLHYETDNYVVIIQPGQKIKLK